MQFLCHAFKQKPRFGRLVNVIKHFWRKYQNYSNLFNGDNRECVRVILKEIIEFIKYFCYKKQMCMASFHTFSFFEKSRFLPKAPLATLTHW